MAPCFSKEQLHRLCNFVSQAYAKSSGRGPIDIRAQIGEHGITVMLSGILSPLEKLLLQKNRSDLVREIRSVIAEELQQSWIAFLARECQVRVTGITSQVDLEQDRATHRIVIAAGWDAAVTRPRRTSS